MSTSTKCQHAIFFSTLGLIIIIVALCSFLAPIGGPGDYIQPVTRIVVLPIDSSTTWAPHTNRSRSTKAFASNLTVYKQHAGDRAEH
ncbi:hypothetical protein BV898_12098 [Hypsibius exemplaris]|uniref:Uncharacterized protein n=1 Tax=Hypsibius exemplaris TaxID=2072580 RepID=A0A1W0WER5_HYPEX|nr:hypothetical protein BV898_12098 [Hypsibius exemplaris]